MGAHKSNQGIILFRRIHCSYNMTISIHLSVVVFHLNQLPFLDIIYNLLFLDSNHG